MKHVPSGQQVGRTWGDGMTVKAVWHIVKESARSIGVAHLAPHDLRRTYARLCHASGGELEQIQFLLGHVSVQTTEVYSAASSGLQATASSLHVSIRFGPPSRVKDWYVLSGGRCHLLSMIRSR
jgi:integrase